eukprot:scaffold228457_cov15-Tisochrysis_lutea.AAC.1
MFKLRAQFPHQGLNDLKERFADLISQGLEDFTAVQRRQSPLGNLLPLDHPSIVSNGSSNSVIT